MNTLEKQYQRNRLCVNLSTLPLIFILLFSNIYTDESWAGRNTCQWIYMYEGMSLYFARYSLFSCLHFLPVHYPYSSQIPWGEFDEMFLCKASHAFFLSRRISFYFVYNAPIKIQINLIFFWHHMKLESSFEFLFDLYLKALLCLQSLSWNICSMRPMECGWISFISGIETLQEYTRFLHWELPFNVHDVFLRTVAWRRFSLFT